MAEHYLRLSGENSADVAAALLLEALTVPPPSADMFLCAPDILSEFDSPELLEILRRLARSEDQSSTATSLAGQRWKSALHGVWRTTDSDSELFRLFRANADRMVLRESCCCLAALVDRQCVAAWEELVGSSLSPLRAMALVELERLSPDSAMLLLATAQAAFDAGDEDKALVTLRRLAKGGCFRRSYYLIPEQGDVWVRIPLSNQEHGADSPLAVPMSQAGLDFCRRREYERYRDSFYGMFTSIFQRLHARAESLLANDQEAAAFATFELARDLSLAYALEPTALPEDVAAGYMRARQVEHYVSESKWTQPDHIEAARRAKETAEGLSSRALSIAEFTFLNERSSSRVSALMCSGDGAVIEAKLIRNVQDNLRACYPQ